MTMPTASIFTGKSNHDTFRVIKSPVVSAYYCLRKYSHMRLHHCMSNNIDSDTCNLAVAGENCSEPRDLYWTHLRSAWLSLGPLFGQCQMMRYYLPIAFIWSDWSKRQRLERTVTNRRGVRNGTAFRLCTDYVLLRNLGILGRWKDTVWKEGR